MAGRLDEGGTCSWHMVDAQYKIEPCLLLYPRLPPGPGSLGPGEGGADCSCSFECPLGPLWGPRTPGRGRVCVLGFGFWKLITVRDGGLSAHTAARPSPSWGLGVQWEGSTSPLSLSPAGTAGGPGLGSGCTGRPSVSQSSHARLALGSHGVGRSGSVRGPRGGGAGPACLDAGARLHATCILSCLPGPRATADVEAGPSGSCRGVDAGWLGPRA